MAKKISHPHSLSSIVAGIRQVDTVPPVPESLSISTAFSGVAFARVLEATPSVDHNEVLSDIKRRIGGNGGDFLVSSHNPREELRKIAEAFARAPEAVKSAFIEVLQSLQTVKNAILEVLKREEKSEGRVLIGMKPVDDSSVLAGSFRLGTGNTVESLGPMVFGPLGLYKGLENPKPLDFLQGLRFLSTRFVHYIRNSRTPINSFDKNSLSTIFKDVLPQIQECFPTLQMGGMMSIDLLEALEAMYSSNKEQYTANPHQLIADTVAQSLKAPNLKAVSLSDLRGGVLPTGAMRYGAIDAIVVMRSPEGAFPPPSSPASPFPTEVAPPLPPQSLTEVQSDIRERATALLEEVTALIGQFESLHIVTVIGEVKAGILSRCDSLLKEFSGTTARNRAFEYVGIENPHKSAAEFSQIFRNGRSEFYYYDQKEHAQFRAALAQSKAEGKSLDWKIGLFGRVLHTMREALQKVLEQQEEV